MVVKWPPFFVPENQLLLMALQPRRKRVTQPFTGLGLLRKGTERIRVFNYFNKLKQSPTLKVKV